MTHWKSTFTAQGFHLKLSDGRDILERLARGDVNMPKYDGSTVDFIAQETKFEAVVFLESTPDIPASHFFITVFLFSMLLLSLMEPEFTCRRILVVAA